MLNNIKNAAGLMANANKVRQQQQKISALLSSIRVSGVSKNSRVSVVITGEQKIVDIQIDPSLINFVYENYTSQNKTDSVLSKSIIEAVENAISKVQKEIATKMQETGSMGDFMSMVQAVSQGSDK
jgi:DNA-binding protein YbaB